MKNGYKQTEVGVIPEDWEVLSIGELVAIGFIEKPLDGNHGEIHPKSSDFVDSGIPFIMANNVYNGIVDLDTCHFIRKEQADNLQKGFSFAGDVLFTHKGTVGNIAIVEAINTEYIMLTPQVTYYRVKNYNKICNTYIKQYFLSDTFQKIIKNISGGGTRAYIGITNQRQLPFILPSFKEQAAIATALSDVDALISALDNLIAKKRLIKQGAMQELLSGKKRLAGFSGDWEVKNLGDIANIIMGQSPSSIFYNDKNIGLPLIQGNADIKNRKTIIRFFTSSITKICHENDIIMSVRAPVGEIALATFKACLGRGVCAIRYENKFLYHYLIFIEKDWLKISKGSTFDSVNSTEIRDLEINIPDKKEQTAIAQILSDMDSDILALETQRNKTQAIKQGIMQELLTGKTRLI